MCEVGLPVRGWQVGFCTFLGEGQHMFPGIEYLIKKVGWFFVKCDAAAGGGFPVKVGWFFDLCRRARSGVV